MLDKVIDMETACAAAFAGVGAISPEAFENSLAWIARKTGRVIDAAFRAEVNEQLKAMTNQISAEDIWDDLAVDIDDYDGDG